MDFGAWGEGGEIILDKIQELSPKNDTQRSLQAQALNMAIDLYSCVRWRLQLPSL